MKVAGAALRVLSVLRPEGNTMLKGSCLCGKVRYIIRGPVGDIVHCHCKTCRKAHGSAFSSVAAVADEDFEISDCAAINSFESSKGKRRYFCGNCGTQLYAKRQGAKHLILRLGSLDSDLEAKEKCHIWTSEKANWYCINNNLAEHPEHE